ADRSRYSSTQPTVMEAPDENPTSTFPEQYELQEKKTGLAQLSRRNFFKYMVSGVATCLVVSDLFASVVLGRLAEEREHNAEDTLAAWIHIRENGKETIFTVQVEVGQNIRTSLAEVV